MPTKAPERREAPLSVRLPRDLEEELRRRAEAEDRPVNQLVKAALARFLDLEESAA